MPIPFTRAVPLAALVILSLAGCASAPTPTPSATLSSIDRQAVLAELGNYPADTPWGESESEREQALADTADQWWDFVTQLFPEAQRPAAATVEEIEFGDQGATLGEALDRCLDAAGVSRGGVGTLEWVPTTVDDAVAWYICRVEYPTAPEPAVNDAQLGWLYDYLSKFVAPCLEARGSTIPTPPTREAFILEWPNQNWFPSSSAAPDTEQNAADSTACYIDVDQYAGS